MLRYRGNTPVCFNRAGRMRWYEVYDIVDAPKPTPRQVILSARLTIDACLSTTDVDAIHKALRDLDAQLKEIAP